MMQCFQPPVSKAYISWGSAETAAAFIVQEPPPAGVLVVVMLVLVEVVGWWLCVKDVCMRCVASCNPELTWKVLWFLRSYVNAPPPWGSNSRRFHM